MPKSIGRNWGKTTLIAAGIAAWLPAALATAQDHGSAVPDTASQPQGNNESDLLNDILPSTGTTTAAPAVENPQPAEDNAAPAAPAAQAESPVPLPRPAEPDAKAAAPRYSRQIEEIVVTATKREESIRDIPASISAFTGAELENQGKLNLYDFIQQSPGVTAAQGASGFTRITMRGISTDTNPYAGNPSPVGVFIGDTAFSDPYTANILPDLSAFDLANVEILKGPQGTLFGGAALSGAIRYELADPVQGEWQFRGFSQYVMADGGGNGLTSGAALNMPLLKEDKLAFRFDYVQRNYPGVYEDGRTGDKAVDHGGGNQVRAILLWEPSDLWKFRLTHLSQDYAAPDALIFAQNPDGPRQNSDFVLPLPMNWNFSLDSFESTLNFDSMRLVALSSKVHKHADFAGDDTASLIGQPPPGYPSQLAAASDVVDITSAFSQELRLQSTGNDPLQWIVGAYFYNARSQFDLLIDFPTVQNLVGPGTALGNLLGSLGAPGSSLQSNTTLLNGLSNAHSLERALFLDVSYKLWDRLDLSAGARFYSTTLSGGYVGTGLLLLAENNLQDSNTSAAITQKGINPKFSATYHFSDDISLYAVASKGFRFGGIQDVPSTATNGVPATYKSDTLWNYELGLRTGWLDDSLHADLTTFYIRYKDPIISQATPGIVSIGFSDNVSSAISQGAELSLLWNTPLDGLQTSLNGGITDAHITAPFKASNGQMVEPGQEMPGTAREQGSAQINYLRPLGIFAVGGNVGYTYVGKGYNDLTHDAEINGFGTLNAGLSLSGNALPMHPMVSLNVSNILNVTRDNAASTGKALLTQVPVNLYTLNPPRQISLRLSLDF